MSVGDGGDIKTLAKKDAELETDEEDDEDLSLMYRSKQFAKLVSFH